MTFTKTIMAASTAALLAAPMAQACAAHAGSTGAQVTLAASHDHGEMARSANAVEAGDLTITGAFSRATPPQSPVGGGYMTITNTGGTDDRLIGIATAISGRAEIHEIVMDGDVARMREIDGLDIPAGETVELAPGGYHLMFMDLAAPLVAGEVAQVTLTFEEAGEVSVPLSIADTDASGPMDHGETH